jgi:PAS domain S-box-containing protein
MNSKAANPRRAALLVWAIGLGLSAFLAWWAHSANQRLYVERLAAISDEVAALVSQRFGLYEYGLRGARGAVVAAGGPAVSRDVFAAYIGTRELAREFPGARGFGFIRRVPRTDEAGFLASARAEGPTNFAIRELGTHDAERFVIQYIYPPDQNEGATGLDVASERNRRDAAIAAARSGRTQITAPITLVQADAQRRRGFLVYLPVFRDGAPLHTPEAREAATFGWTYAPLVADDVLAELGPNRQMVGLRLTDSAESEAFFDSTPAGTEALAGIPETQREITVHGRRWQLQIRALPMLAEHARPTSAAGVAASGVAGTTLLALLVWLALKRNRQDSESANLHAGTSASFRRFLSSPLLHWAALAYLSFFAVYLWLGHEDEWTRQLNAARQKLTTLVDERASRLREAQQARRKALVFLANVPPVQGLVRALPSGVDPQDGSWRETWELRMRQILTAHLNASPEVYRARFVGLADGGRELVRVERRGADIVATTTAEMDPLAQHPDVKQALRLNAGEVWISELDLNREQGRLELPHRPTIRYLTPVFQPDGKTFGVVMVHVDVGDRLAESVVLAPEGGALYVLNAAGDFLFHPVAARRFGSDLGQGHRWADEFQDAVGSYQLADGDRLQVLQGQQGPQLVASAVVSPNLTGEVGTIHYQAMLPLAQLETAIWSALGRSLWLPLAAGAVGTLLMFFYWASEQRQLQARGQRLRLALIVDQSVDAIVGLDAAQCVSSWNRGAQRLFGFEAKEAIGRRLFELIGAELDTGSTPAPPWGEGGRPTQEFACCAQDGRRLRVAMTWSQLSGGEAGESSAVLRDVTEERAAQSRIVNLNGELEQRVQERTEMLDVLAHEVRQPLHNASAAMESARDVLVSDGSEESANLMLRAQAVLVDVQRSLDNTLAVASLLARPDPIHLDDADIDTLIGVAIADMPSSERGRIQICRETATRTVLLDASLMRLALRNLLSNALKFSPAGSVVTVRIADSDRPLGLLIAVGDQGAGVPPELQPRLFLRGGRGNGSGSGHGLGLYIVQQVMKLHQGSVELVETGPAGSTFRLMIVQETWDA